MDNYKHFIAGVSNVVLANAHVITEIEDGVKPQVSSFVKLIDAVKYEDGYYHTYYKNMKAVMKSFIIYWRETMDIATKRADYLCHKAVESVDKELMVLNVVNTIRLWQDYQKKLYKDFLPIESLQQQKVRNTSIVDKISSVHSAFLDYRRRSKSMTFFDSPPCSPLEDAPIYDDLDEKFTEHMKQLYELKLHVEKMDRNDKVVAFAKEQYAKSVELKNKVFLYAHNYISMLLADHLPEIGGSLKEILNQTRKNLKQLLNEREASVSDLLNKLYEKNKEQMIQTRQKRTSMSQMAEINSNIEKIRTQVLNSGNHDAILKVKEKLELFEKRYATFERIANNLNMLKAELEKTYREESIYNSRMTTELPGSKFQCWQAMGKNFATRKEELKQLLIKAAKSLTTFFVVKSMCPDVMLYESDIGNYSLDLFGHVVYHFDYGLKQVHLDCQGNYSQPYENHATYINENGEYFLQNNEKVYQKSECSSVFKLGDDMLMKKVSTDCGHSERTMDNCAMCVNNRTDGVILPDVKPIDIKRTLNSEVVNYLWDALGAILPDALYDVCKHRPKNPIHSLAHNLLKHKYNKTPAELLQKKKESLMYRANILDERKERAIAESLAWKAKQQKRTTIEHTDDSYMRAVYDIYRATNEFIVSLSYND